MQDPIVNRIVFVFCLSLAFFGTQAQAIDWTPFLGKYKWVSGNFDYCQPSIEITENGPNDAHFDSSKHKDQLNVQSHYYDTKNNYELYMRFDGIDKSDMEYFNHTNYFGGCEYYGVSLIQMKTGELELQARRGDSPTICRLAKITSHLAERLVLDSTKQMLFVTQQAQGRGDLGTVKLKCMYKRN
jgi:hypothetical protein